MCFKAKSLLIIALFSLNYRKVNCQTKTKDIVSRLDNFIKPIQSLEPDSSFSDIDFLKEHLKDKDIVSLGEVTHGTKEVLKYKDRLIRYLVSNLVFKAIAFETDYFGMERLDQFINGKIDSTTISPYYKPLMLWLKKYNLDKTEQERVHVYGLEITDFNNVIDKVLIENPNLSEENRTLLLKVKKTQLDKLDKKTFNDFKIISTSLSKSINSQLLSQLIDNYYNYISLNGKIGIRDAFMAKNAIWLKEKAQNSKLIISAHNGHVAKTALYNQPAMGMFLNEKYGSKYFVIATDINKGYVSVRKFVAKNKPISDWQPLYYSAVNEKSYEYYFGQCKYKNFIFDIGTASVDLELKTFLTRPLNMRMIGALSTPADKNLSMTQNFDMIVYFDENSSL